MDKEKNTLEVKIIAFIYARNEKGIELLYENYSQTLYGYIFRMVKSEVIAEEVLQEAFVKIWMNFSSYDQTKGRLFTWILKLTRNLALDKLRSREISENKKNISGDKINSVVDHYHSEHINTDKIGLRDLVTKLDSDKRKLIEMIYFFGFTQSEVAEELNIPLGTVKTRVRASLRQLRENFFLPGS